MWPKFFSSFEQIQKNVKLSEKKVIFSKSGEKYIEIKHSLQAETVVWILMFLLAVWTKFVAVCVCERAIPST